jgi:uncharacterized membrane protein YbhN (UPF0104 family)
MAGRRAQDRRGAPDHPFRLDGRRILVSLVVAVALLLGALALIGEVSNTHRLTRALADADRAWLPLCVVGELLAYAGYILAYRDFARVGGGPDLSVWTVTRVVVIGFGAFVFGSAPGGLAVDYWALERATGRGHESARRVLGLNTLEWAALGVLTCAAAVIVLIGRSDEVATPMAIAWVVIVPVCVVLALWFTQPRRADRFAAVADIEVPPAPPRLRDVRVRARRLVALTRIGLADALGGVIIVRTLLASPLRYPAGTTGFLVYWAGDLLALDAALHAFGIHLGPARLVLAYTSAYIITALPLPVGGAGATEATLAWTLNLVGVAFAPGVLAAAVYRGFAFWLPIVPALAFVPLTRGLADDLDRIRSRGAGASGGLSAPGTG